MLAGVSGCAPSLAIAQHETPAHLRALPFAARRSSGAARARDRDNTARDVMRWTSPRIG
jgi:hypothetical protein